MDKYAKTLNYWSSYAFDDGSLESMRPTHDKSAHSGVQRGDPRAVRVRVDEIQTCPRIIVCFLRASSLIQPALGRHLWWGHVPHAKIAAQPLLVHSYGDFEAVLRYRKSARAGRNTRMRFCVASHFTVM